MFGSFYIHIPKIFNFDKLNLFCYIILWLSVETTVSQTILDLVQLDSVIVNYMIIIE